MASMDTGPLLIPPSASAFGFSLRRSGGHLSRSLMLPELGLLFAAGRHWFSLTHAYKILIYI
jgi:hypothetical protein